jgi:nitrate reductase NapE component
LKDIINLLLSSFKPDYAAVRAMFFRLIIIFVVFCIASVIAVLGLGFLVWSLYLYLETFWNPYVAALLSGASAIAIAIILVLIAGFATGYMKVGGKTKFKPEPGPAGFASDPAELINRYPLESGLTAAIVGFVVGSSGDTPKTLTELLTLLKETGQK